MTHCECISHRRYEENIFLELWFIGDSFEHHFDLRQWDFSLLSDIFLSRTIVRAQIESTEETSINRKGETVPDSMMFE